MAAVATGSTTMSPSRRLLLRSQRAAASEASTTTYSTRSEDRVFGNKDTNQSTSALSNLSTASRTSRFFRRFARSKPPPVPSLPPALVLDLDAGTAKPRTDNGPIQSSAASQSNKINGDNKQSAAAAIIAESNAAYAAAEAIPIPVGLQRSKMIDAIANARLNVAQTRDLVRMCGVHIRERGLDTPGLFRPFRISENPNHTFHLIQLFLLSIDVSTYIAVFPILPENALDRLDRKTNTGGNDRKAKIAREELDKELRYAQPHDIVNFLKWGLRHMRLRPSDLHSKDADEWYTSFCSAERESQYHARAIADLLHPKLPQATAELLSETLDLMASVAAHSSSNHMPASTLCRVLGFWLLGKIGVAHPPPTYDQLAEAIDKAAAMTEHLLLAHIRSQAAVTFSMPLRLMELVKAYPYIKPGGSTPSLPPAFASRTVPTLRIDLRSENLVISQTKPRMSSAILKDALDASASEDLHGGKGDLWANILTQLDRADGTGSNAGFKLLSDEHVRILTQVEKELNPESPSEPKVAEVKEETTPTTIPTPSTDVRKSRRRSQSLSTLPRVPLAPLSEVTNSPSKSTTSPVKPASTLLSSPRRKPVPLLNPGEADESDEVENLADLRSADGLGGLEPSATWRSFSEEGFGGMSTASSDLSLSSFELPPTPTHPGMPSRRSTRSIHRVKSLTGSTRRRQHQPSRPPLPSSPESRAQNSKITGATLAHVDAALALVWEDQLLDPSACASLPPLLFVQLSENVVKRIKDQEGEMPKWLLISETAIPPRPPTPKMEESGGAGGGERGDAGSIFAPSMRTVKMRLRRVSTVIGSSLKRDRDSRPPPPPLPIDQ